MLVSKLTLWLFALLRRARGSGVNGICRVSNHRLLSCSRDKKANVRETSLRSSAECGLKWESVRDSSTDYPSLLCHSLVISSLLNKLYVLWTSYLTKWAIHRSPSLTQGSNPTPTKRAISMIRPSRDTTALRQVRESGGEPTATLDWVWFGDGANVSFSDGNTTRHACGKFKNVTGSTSILGKDAILGKFTWGL